MTPHSPRPSRTDRRVGVGSGIRHRAGRRAALVTGAAALAAASLLLAGCSTLMDSMHKVHSESFDDHVEAAKGWIGVQLPEWIPASATDIRNVATDDETNAVIAAKGGDLPSWCLEMPRQGLPFDTRFGKIGLPDRVQRCGDYEIVDQDGEWIGWYSAREPGAKPSAGAVPVSHLSGSPSPSGSAGGSFSGDAPSGSASPETANG
ncbi:hypothetical protein GCM10027515_31380 [Schumannella luteola]|uniref:Uncharacterized protein n=1 Tax=Schumannella luteola TaxID=472059 RepID=A0A852YD14_9MICO|nr:hypothetical protein [Schumannella luteola]NYG99061.1 hypothetical protein [Schumannella luteola]